MSNKKTKSKTEAMRNRSHPLQDCDIHLDPITAHVLMRLYPDKKPRQPKKITIKKYSWEK